MNKIPLIDLAQQRRRVGPAVDSAMRRVADHGVFIMGPEVAELESALADFCGARHVISCASGTDALLVVLMAKGVGPDDAVFVPTFTFAATAEVVALLGATPIFVDVDPDTFNMDVESLVAGIGCARRLGLRATGVITVDLFGQPADYDTILPLANAHGLWTLCDSAQSLGASYKGQRIGSIGTATATSFFPAKPLGCYGDGGAVFTNDAELAAVMRSLRIHGQGTDKYDNVRIGLNGRLDTLQAAVLLEKLRIFPEEIDLRDRVAARYNAHLADVAKVPLVLQGCRSVWAQYTLRVSSGHRDSLAALLSRKGVSTAVYYPKPLHRQSAYRSYPVAGAGLPVAEGLAGEVISLPMHPYLDEETQDRIIDAVRSALSELSGLHDGLPRRRSVPATAAQRSWT